MASRMKGFFPEKKKLGLGVSKPKKSSSSISVKAKAKAKAEAASPPPPLVDLQDEKEEEVLRQFDMNMAFGPCVGMMRLDRWNRANALGLHPPKEVLGYLQKDSSHSQCCLWDGRV